MSHELCQLDVRDSVETAVEAMSRSKQPCVVVCREFQPRGIVTERDVTMMYTSALPPDSDVVLATVMQTPILVLGAQETIAAALGRVDELNCPFIPIVDGRKRLIGLLELRELLAACAEIFASAGYTLPPRRPR